MRGMTICHYQADNGIFMEAELIIALEADQSHDLPSCRCAPPEQESREEDLIPAGIGKHSATPYEAAMANNDLCPPVATI